MILGLQFLLEVSFCIMVGILGPYKHFIRDVNNFVYALYSLGAL